MKVNIMYQTSIVRCPHCKEVIASRTKPDSGFATFTMFLAFPLYILIKELGFGDPQIPLVNPRGSKCPHCCNDIFPSLTWLLGNKKEAIIYDFQDFFTVSYILGGICSIILYHYLLAYMDPEISMPGPFELWFLVGSLLVVLIIIIVFQIKCANCKCKLNTSV